MHEHRIETNGNDDGMFTCLLMIQSAAKLQPSVFILINTWASCNQFVCGK